MIDNLEKVDRLIAMLRQNLPLVATMSPELVAVVREENPDIGASVQCRITCVDYSGDPGGIMCALDCISPNGAAYVVSITHLSFDRRQPAAREIAAYQKHRLKGIRREMLLEDCRKYA